MVIVVRSYNTNSINYLYFISIVTTHVHTNLSGTLHLPVKSQIRKYSQNIIINSLYSEFSLHTQKTCETYVEENNPYTFIPEKLKG